MLLTLILVGFIETGAIGFLKDPLVNGVSFIAGKKEGIRTHLVFSFGSGEVEVESAYYYQNTQRDIKYYFYRPYSWVNWGIRAERHFKNYTWYQPYLGIGLEGKRDLSWLTTYYEYDTIVFVKPIPTKTIYWGPIATAGLTFYPIKMFSGLDIPFAKALIVNIEIVAFYLPWRHFDSNSGYSLGFIWPHRRYSGIDIGTGIHYHW
ncbi:MAG: hypothetical protein ABIK10_03135 [candidate division WOR-3 bacterium]